MGKKWTRMGSPSILTAGGECATVFLKYRQEMGEMVCGFLSGNGVGRKRSKIWNRYVVMVSSVFP